MRSIAVALCMAALAGAAGMIDVRSDSVSFSMPEAERQPYESTICNCKTGGECDCVDCDCDGCPCGEVAARKIAAIDPVTGMAVGGPAIIQLSTSGCLPCVRWEAEEKPKYLRQGWEVPAPVYGTAAPVYPSFRIYDGNRWHQHTGWLTGDDMRRILGGGTASSSNPRASVGAAVVRFPAAAAVSSGRDWLIGGQPWTRQGLIDHLAIHSSHGHSRASLQSMSFDHLNALHNSDHESQRAPVRPTVMSGCPGGSCPPQSYSGRGGVFGLGIFRR